MIPAAIDDAFADATLCDLCGRESCEDHLSPDPNAIAGLDPAFLADAVDVIREGKQIAEEGIRYTVDGVIPSYGMLGMSVAFAKVGKTTLGQALGAAVCMKRPFLDRETTRTRVLVIAAEDPPEYTAYLARVLDVEPSWMTFYRAPVLLNSEGLRAIGQTVADGGYGLVLIASWQAVVRGLVKDENDNAGAVQVVEMVKAFTRQTGIPWLIDAHSGKGEDQADDADPSKAMRGASGAAGAADYTLSLRYSNGAFGTQRRFSGKGRFVNFPPLTIDLDPYTGIYTVVGSTKHASAESTWDVIRTMSAIDSTPRSVTDIAKTAGLLTGDRLSGTARRHVVDALRKRPGVLLSQEIRRGQTVNLYRLEAL
jgi:hypothetical protein